MIRVYTEGFRVTPEPRIPGKFWNVSTRTKSPPSALSIPGSYVIILFYLIRGGVGLFTVLTCTVVSEVLKK